ncbi:hypothetical protein DLM45_15865 [Hyphomicrobium methylovorum]|uniref:hypothetical protein n=1 Tax=Hyphomicrobium methylovorum TaxID=84 RepID=UPI0015E6314C|nr:hypothetical protein [Hyphomicrobium methylovorum]MBA2127688.1 hypothetical protein [Hyphomicrobium methylovorum]
MDYVLAPVFWILSFIFNLAVWVIWQLFWIAFWLILPIVVVAFVALRIAERVLGRDRVAAWVKARTAKYGAAASQRARRITFALGVAPLRVLFWFPIYAMWHSIISLLWRPKWSPWQRAWSRRSPPPRNSESIAGDKKRA